MSGVFTIIDNTPPTISISKPTSDYSVEEYKYIDVDWTSSDNIGMDSINIYQKLKQISYSSLKKKNCKDLQH